MDNHISDEEWCVVCSREGLCCVNHTHRGAKVESAYVTSLSSLSLCYLSDVLHHVCEAYTNHPVYKTSAINMINRGVIASRSNDVVFESVGHSLEEDKSTLHIPDVLV